MSVVRRTAQGGLVLVSVSLPFVLACPPLSRGTLEVTPQRVAVGTGEVHFIVRVSPQALAEADAIGISASVTDASSIALLPDSADHVGVSVRSDGRGGAVAYRDFIDAVGASCGTAAPCELGMTAIVEDADAAAELSIAVVASRRPDETFSEAASLELVIDGLAAVSAERRSR